jgi:F0F1-type ATP synthase assembly protein I
MVAYRIINIINITEISENQPQNQPWKCTVFKLVGIVAGSKNILIKVPKK